MATITSTTTAFAFASGTVSSTALDIFDFFTDAQVQDATQALITVEGADIRFRYDGTAPTASIGHLWVSGEKVVLYGEHNVQALQLIADGSDATVSITLEGLV